MAQPHVIVVGAGVVGSAVALALVQQGARVTLVDRDDPLQNASYGSLAWLNVSSCTDPIYGAIRLQSLSMWHGIAEQTDCPVSLPGAVLWEQDAHGIADQVSFLSELGAPARQISQTELGQLEPGLAVLPEAALFTPIEGFAYPGLVADWFSIAAEDSGATVHDGVEVRRLLTQDNRVTGVELMDGETLMADHVVVAAGAETPNLLGTIDQKVPLTRSPGLLVRSTPGTPVAAHFLATPNVHFWQSSEGWVLAGADYSGAPSGDDSAQAAQQILADVMTLFPGIGALQVDEIIVRDRPMPKDDRPLVGRLPGLDGVYVATTHSGMTLAPLIAAVVAEEILTDKELPQFAPYRPDRVIG